MNRFEKVIAILDQAVGGPDVPVGFPHVDFWRGISRDAFVAKKIFGLQLVTLGDGAGSIVVKALKGETPFGADTGNIDADFNRMPSGLPPVPDAAIAFIQTWIDDGCPEDDVPGLASLSSLPAAKLQSSPARTVSRRLPKSVARQSRFATLNALVQDPQHDLDWLHDALQSAIQLELATLPPYLTARWSIKNQDDPVAELIFEVRGEEMLHMGLACNLLTAIGGTPLIADAAVAPNYPGPLPLGIRPGLIVPLRKLDLQQAKVFMEIEYPQHGPVSFTASNPPVTIGEFYESILTAFKKLNPPLSVGRQLGGVARLFKIDSIAKVEQAIQLINLQGEGSNTSPEEAPGKLAHFYQFGEIVHGKRFVRDESGHWDYTGDSLPLPEVHDMADIPQGGYRQEQVPDVAAWSLIEQFDREYSEMLRLLQSAWTHGDQRLLGNAVNKMFDVNNTGTTLIEIPRSNGPGNYGPCFRYVPSV